MQMTNTRSCSVIERKINNFFITYSITYIPRYIYLDPFRNEIAKQQLRQKNYVPFAYEGAERL
jgi:hypothetical protein